MGMKSLESTYIYSVLNRSSGLTNNISGLILKGKIMTREEVAEPILIISKNFKFPLKFKVLDAFDKGIIQLKYDPASKLPTCMPFVLTKQRGEIVCIVDTSIYGVYDEETSSLNIDSKKLYCMMESAYIARVCFLNDKALSTRNVLLSYGSNIYANIFVRVLNKKYSLNIDKTKMHKVIFLASKFFLYNLVGLRNHDLIFNYSIKNCTNANIYTIQDLDELTNDTDFESFDKFIEMLGRANLGLNMKDLTIRNYLESFIHMYYESMLLSLESLPYFLYNVISVTNGAYINNQYMLETIVDNMGAKIYNDIINLDK